MEVKLELGLIQQGLFFLIIQQQMESNNSKFMDSRDDGEQSSEKKGNYNELEEERKIRRYKLAKMQSYNKFDIKGIIRLQYLEEKKKELLYSYNSTRLSRELPIKSKSKAKRMDMIIPSFQAFNINATFLSGFNEYDTQKSLSRPKTQSRNARDSLKRGRSMQDSVNLSKNGLQIQVKLPIPQSKTKIYWNRNTSDINKQSYGMIHNKNEKNTERKFRSKNVENILRRKAGNFPEMMEEYCRRMKIDEKTRIFIFQSGDTWVKQILLDRGWVLNSDVSSKIFHLKWTSKVPTDKADENQLINHFYDSDCLTSKEGLAKMVKDSRYLTRCSPRSFDLGTQLKQFVVNFNQTQILCCLKKIAKEIERNMMVPSQIISKSKLKKSFSRLRTDQNYEQRSAQHNFVVHVPYAVQICGLCENIRCDLEQQARQLQNRIGERTSKNLFNFSMLNPPYNQYQTQTGSSQLSSTSPKIHFNPSDINLYSSILSFSKPSAELINLLYSYHTYFCDNLHTYRAEGINNIWIVKNRNSSKGIGITLSYNLHELVKKTDNKLVQKYIEDCALYRQVGQPDGFKYDLRVWVLVTSFNPIICYFYQDFYCRLCSQPYSFNTLNNLESHLTNYSQNKQSFQLSQKSSIIHYSEFLEMAGSKMGVPQQEIKNKINKELHDLVFQTINSYKNMIKSYQECFQLYGFDIILSQSLEMFLLEVNLSPACTERDEWLSQNVRRMGKGLLDIVIDYEKVSEGWIPVLD